MTSASVIRRGALLAFLLLPFALREVDGRWEAYPAVLLPTGEETLDTTHSTLDIGRIELSAVDGEGRERQLDPEQFFAPLPEQYWSGIVANRFGFGGRRLRTTRFGIWTVTVSHGLENMGNEQETRRWIRSRLQRLGTPNPAALRVRRVTVTYDVNRRMEVSRAIGGTFDVHLVS